MNNLKKIKTAILTIAFSTIASMGVFAQDHDNSKAPHGGKVEEAGAYHIEALIKDGKAYFYLLDGKAMLMSNKGVSGTVLLQFANGISKNITLTASGDDGFVANNDSAAFYTKAIVTFKVNGKTASAKFNGKTTAIVYSCPMHPEVTSDKQGKCPKCQMDLVEKKTKKEEHHHNH